MQRNLVLIALFALAVGVFSADTGLDKDKVCKTPQGGGIIVDKDANGRVHCFDKGKCFPWRHSTCDADNKYCQCREDQCIDDGECIDKGACKLNTGGGCKVLGCDSWRNAACSSDSYMSGEQCVCPEGQCAVKGECVARGACPKYSTHTCRILGCYAGHGTCQDGYCVCGDGECAVDGKCVSLPLSGAEDVEALMQKSRQGDEPTTLPFELGLALLAASAIGLVSILGTRRARSVQEPSVNYVRLEQ